MLMQTPPILDDPHQRDACFRYSVICLVVFFPILWLVNIIIPIKYLVFIFFAANPQDFYGPQECIDVFRSDWKWFLFVLQVFLLPTIIDIFILPIFIILACYTGFFVCGFLILGCCGVRFVR